MHAAEEGRSTIGIPKNVGADFVNASHGIKVGALPKRVGPTDHHAKALTHANAVVSALKKGDHKSAMSHIGHTMLATRAAANGSSPAATPDEPEQQDNASDEAAEQTGFDTPAPSPRFFGQVAPAKKPKTPALPSTASAQPTKGGFNRTRFAAMKK